MIRIGVVGTGNMGGMLAIAFASHSDVQVTAFNRTREKALRLVSNDKPIRIADSLEEIARSSEVIFVCTKANDGDDVIARLGPLLSPAQVLATSISTVNLHEWEAETEARVVKVIPSITQTVSTGVMLVTYGDRFGTDEADNFEQIIRKVASPFVVDESQVRVCSDLASCGPAFISAILLEWAQAASATGRISAAEAEHILCTTLLGMTTLLGAGFTLQDIVKKVAIPGGVTQTGLQGLRPAASEMFEALHDSTQNHQHVKAHSCSG